MTTYLEFAARGKNAWWRYLVSSVLASLIAVLLGAVIVLCLEGLQLVPGNFAAELTRPTHPVTFFAGTGIIFGVVLAGLVLAIGLLQGKRFEDVVGRWSWNMFYRGIGIWAAIEIIASLVDFLMAPHGFKITVTDGTPILAICAVFGLSVQTFAEEFIFRGYLTQAFLLATKQPLTAAASSGLLFSALHISNGAHQAVSALFFGIVTSLIAIRTGGIAFTFGLHLMNNVFAAVIVVSADDVFNGISGLFTQNTPQLLWWDVGVTSAALFGVLWLLRRLRIVNKSEVTKTRPRIQRRSRE